MTPSMHLWRELLANQLTLLEVAFQQSLGYELYRLPELTNAIEDRLERTRELIKGLEV